MCVGACREGRRKEGGVREGGEMSEEGDRGEKEMEEGKEEGGWRKGRRREK